MNTEVLLRKDAYAAGVRRGRYLQYITIMWNSLEAIIAVGAGLLAGSVALIGFGVDSLIEVSSGAVLLWRLAGGDRREAMALKLVGASLLSLAAYVGFNAAKSLIAHEAPEESITGIVLAALSLIVMPLLAREKRRAAAHLNSRAMVADSRQTDICALLSAILLIGLSLNWLFGWWWCDPVAALIMIPIIIREGLEAWRGKACCGGETCAEAHLGR